MMKNNFDPNIPIYLQVMEEIKKDIFNKKYLPGNKIPSVRELALQYAVNPNTIQKSLSELERDGLLRSERAIGRFVTDEIETVKRVRKEMMEEIIKKFLEEMRKLGFSKEETINKINEIDA